MEITPTPATTQKTELSPFITQQLDTLPVKAEDLKALVEKYSGLTINGVEDREGLTKVYEARQDVKKKRVLIEKGAKALRDIGTAFNKAVKEKENELVSIISPLEDSLQKMEDDIAIEKKRLRDEEDARQAKIIQDKIDRLSAVGYAVDFVQLKGMTDEQFEEVLNEATKSHQEKLEREKKEQEEREAEALRKEEERKAEVKRLEEQRIAQEEERKKLAAQQAEIQAEKDKLEKIRLEQEAKIKAEQDRIAAENKAKEDKLREEQEIINQQKEELARQKFETRLNRIEALGLVWNGYNAIYTVDGKQRFYVDGDHFRNLSDESFDVLVRDTADVKAKADKSIAAEREAQIEKEKQAAAFAERQRIEAEQKAAEEAAAKKAEEERQALLASDDRNLFEYLAGKMRDLNEDEAWRAFKSDKGTLISDSARRELLEIIDTLETASAKPTE